MTETQAISAVPVIHQNSVAIQAASLPDGANADCTPVQPLEIGTPTTTHN